MEEQGKEVPARPAEEAPPDQPADACGESAEARRERNERNAHSWGMLCHLSALLGFVGIPFGRILGPLVVWLVKRGDYDFVEEQGKEALNFQISMAVYTLASAFLICLCIGLPLLILIQVVDFVLVIVASVKSSTGRPYRYPLAIRFIQ